MVPGSRNKGEVEKKKAIEEGLREREREKRGETLERVLEKE